MKLDTQMLAKPAHLPSNTLIAVHGIYDTPQTTQNVMSPTYQKSELAVNETKGLVQVYVMAEDVEGLENFQEDFPNAEIYEEATLENADEWRVIAFSSEAMPDESTALDNYFLVRGRELS